VAKKPKQAPTRKPYIAKASGTDADIMAECAANVEGWAGLSERGKAEMVRLARAYRARPVAPVLEVVSKQGGIAEVKVPDEQEIALHTLRLTDTFATNSAELTNAHITELARYHCKADTGGLSSQNLSASLAFVNGAGVEDSVQAALAVQMAATHDAAMRAISVMSSAQSVESVQVWGNIANKLGNTFARQAEVLAKLQRGGEQVVKHIHIDNRGGQAVVTEQVVTTGGSPNVQSQCHEPSTPLLGENPAGYSLPVSSSARPEPLPSTRGLRRRAKRQ